MKQSSTFFLKAAVLLIGVIVVSICVFALPRVIGTVSMGGYDPILLGLYIAAIPFFIALYQALKLLSYIDKNKAFSHSSIAAIKKIKYCAVMISLLFIAGSPYIYHVANKDDAPGVVAIAMVITGASFVIATFAAVLQKLFQNAMDIKSENDLTV